MTTEGLFGAARHLMWTTVMTPAAYLIHSSSSQASSWM